MECVSANAQIDSQPKPLPRRRSILSIDPGIHNVGMIFLDYCCEEFTVKQVHEAYHTNITHDLHYTVRREDCTLHHTNILADRMSHFFQAYEDVFTKADVILIEKQPMVGFTDVEQLLFRQFREKAVLVYPRQMHCYFKINHLDYDNRKIATTKIAKERLETTQVWQRSTRKHDMADAFCLAIFWLHLQREERHKKERECKHQEKQEQIRLRVLKLREENITIGQLFERFRFKKTGSLCSEA